MASTSFKYKVVQFSQQSYYDTMVANGSVTVDGVTYEYSPSDTIYVTPDSVIHSADIVQSTGQNTDKVMSQKAVTDELSGKIATGGLKTINSTSLEGSGNIVVQTPPSKVTITDNTTVALADNTEYSGTDLSTVTFTYPQGDFECCMSLNFADSGTITVTFPTSQYIGSVPTFENGKTYEISIKNGVIVAGEVTSGA